MAVSKSRRRWERFIKSVWFFPVLLALPFLALTVFRISGSSVGAYYPVIYGSSAKDPGLLFGHPQSIRSDEWLVDTQLALAQKTAGYPKTNSNLGTGIDMAVQGDAPYKDWSTIFKPQNLSFLIMPFDNAFAFKWWFLLYGLIVSCYFFCLRLFAGKRLFAAIFATAIGLSPFVFWWYLSGTIMPLTYSFLILIVGMRIIDNEPIEFAKDRSWLSNSMYAIALAYLLIAFGLILYPPFQIPVAIVTTFFMLGYLLKAWADKSAEHSVTAKRLLVFVASLLIATLIGGIFYLQNRPALQSLSNTAYPGVRTISSGGISYLNVFDSFLQPQLESSVRGTHFFNNQSEASSFILLSPFLVVPTLAAMFYEYKKQRRVDWLFLSILLIVLLLFSRIFWPYGNGFFKLLLLNRVPHERLMIGVGLASVLLTLLLVKKLRELKPPPKLLLVLAFAYSAVCFAIVCAIGFHVSHVYPLFIHYALKIVALAAVFCAIIFFLLANRMLAAATVLLIFSLGSVVKINPLYRGLGWIESNQVYSHIQTQSKPGDNWAAADVLVFENLPVLANRDSVSGVKLYPNLNFWKKAAPGAQDIYNRYAHVVFVSSPTWSGQLHLVQPDFFEVNLNCSAFIKNNIDYVLDTSLLNLSCLSVKDKVVYPAATFYIYKVSPVTK